MTRIVRVQEIPGVKPRFEPGRDPADKLALSFGYPIDTSRASGQQVVGVDAGYAGPHQVSRLGCVVDGVVEKRDLSGQGTAGIRYLVQGHGQREEWMSAHEPAEHPPWVTAPVGGKDRSPESARTRQGVFRNPVDLRVNAGPQPWRSRFELLEEGPVVVLGVCDQAGLGMLSEPCQHSFDVHHPERGPCWLPLGETS